MLSTNDPQWLRDNLISILKQAYVQAYGPCIPPDTLIGLSEHVANAVGPALFKEGPSKLRGVMNIKNVTNAMLIADMQWRSLIFKISGQKPRKVLYGRVVAGLREWVDRNKKQ